MSAVEQIFQGSIQGAIDPVFAYMRAGRLDCPPGVDPLAAWRHLSGQVARDALDVEAHVRRVLLACQPPLTERAFGALVDIWRETEALQHFFDARRFTLHGHVEQVGM